MKIEAISIDFWNTLFDSSGGKERNYYRYNLFKNTISELGFDIDPQLFEKAITATWEHFNNIWKNELRTPHPQETLGFVWNYLKLPYSPEIIDRIITGFANSILVYPPKLIDGVKQSLEILSKKYKLGIVSDTGFSPGSVLRKLLEKENIINYFSAFSFSDETGVAKPHPKAYLTVLKELNCPPENAIHIGDIEETDIIGAKNLNMKAIRFSGDSTAFLNTNNTPETKAEFDAKSWEEIVQYITENY